MQARSALLLAGGSGLERDAAVGDRQDDGARELHPE
jgi:hypothetical protein